MTAKKPAEEINKEVPEKLNAEIDYYASADYDSLINSQEVDTIPGWAVVGPDEPVTKDKLVGSPFLIVGAVFRPSEVSVAQYVSVLAMSKEYGTLCINDGSTGIRSQILEYCVRKGIAKYVGPESKPMYTEAVNNYEWFPPASVSFMGETGEGQDEIRVDIPFATPLHCPRGLRVSKDYESKKVNPETGKPFKGTTYYLG